MNGICSYSGFYLSPLWKRLSASDVVGSFSGRNTRDAAVHFDGRGLIREDQRKLETSFFRDRCMLGGMPARMSCCTRFLSSQLETFELGDLLGNVKPAMLLPTGEAILFYYLYIWIWCCIAWLNRLIPKERERDENNTVNLIDAYSFYEHRGPCNSLSCLVLTPHICCNSKMAKNANNLELEMEKQIQLHEEHPDGCGGVGFGLYDLLTFSVELCVTVIKVRCGHFLDILLLLF
ncbi:hypothetical protein COP1_014758 [Malus domestica]